MSMPQALILIPGILALGTPALQAQPGSPSIRYFVQDGNPLPDPQPPVRQNTPPTGVIGDVHKADPGAIDPDEQAGLTKPTEEAVNAQDDEEDDPNSSDAIRSRRTQAVEFFVDYSTFVTDQEDFSPFAYGLKYYRFIDRDLKLGASVAVEQFQWNDDESDVVNGTTIRQRGVDLEGTAVRFGLHAQYFVENSLNAQISVFGAAGNSEKSGDIDSQFYGRTGVTLNLGNQWSWEDFSLSWNWLSLTYNASAKVGSTNLLTKYPSNRSGGMVLISGLGFGAEW